DVLMVVHPAEFSESTLYAIDQFVLTGGRLVVFADPLSESAAAGNPSSALAQEYPPDRLLRSWGVALEAGKVVGDLTFAQRVNYPGRSRPRAGNYLPWLALPEQAVNQDEIATINLKQINMATAGSLQRTEDAATDFIPLIRSSDKAMLIEKHRVAFAPDPAGLMAEFSPTGEVYTLAARVTGRVKTAFPDGPPEEGSDSGKGGGTAGEDRVVQRGHIEESEVPANIVIIADADLLEDRFWVDVRNFFGQRIAFPMADNADFVVNVLEQLGGSGDLIGIRSRGPSSRPFTRVEEIRREAERKHLAKEQELLARLDETERKLNELQRMREDPDSPALTPEQEQEVERFRGEKVKIRQELREVQYQLRREIERLEVWLKFINILLVPVLISLTATGAWIVRRRRDRGFSA
ncbi:MAG: Gldg family protein, partial [bacterium]